MTVRDTKGATAASWIAKTVMILTFLQLFFFLVILMLKWMTLVKLYLRLCAEVILTAETCILFLCEGKIH